MDSQEDPEGPLICFRHQTPLTEQLAIKAGYRYLEGGADVDEVYNFTLVQFAVAGLIIQL